MHIDFDNYENIVIIPSPDKIDNNSNLNWMKFRGNWGHVLSLPSSGAAAFYFGQILHGGILFNMLDLLYDIPEDVGNIAPAGPPHQKPWENLGPTSGQSAYQ